MRRHHGRALSPYHGRTASPPSAEVSLVRSFDSKINPSRPARQSPLATSQIGGMPLDLIDRIRSFPLFQSTSDDFLADIGLLLKPQLYNTNDYIMIEGEDAKAMYWLVRGAVAVTSRDGESIFAELKPGAFFGEIGILMERPRTATVVARTRCMVVVLKKEDLKKILPKYPDVEQAIREEALERLTQLEKKKAQVLLGTEDVPDHERRGSKRARPTLGDDAYMAGSDGSANSKRRKSPSPGTNEVSTASALGHGLVNIRATLKELPLFASLPPDILHFLGLSAQPRSFAPFTDIVKQDRRGREIYFIVRGEVEVLDERKVSHPKLHKSGQPNGIPRTPVVKARLKPGQYFGEVVSRGLADRRTATVRSVTQVECLMISENVLADFWNRCPPSILQQIEETAKHRLKLSFEADVVMKDADATPDIRELEIEDGKERRTRKLVNGPRVTFTDAGAEISSSAPSVQKEEPSTLEPSDPDPFLSEGLEKVRSRSRRGSLAPPPPDEPSKDQKRRSPRSSPTNTASPSPKASVSGTPSPTSEYKGLTGFPFSDPFSSGGRPKPRARSSRGLNRGTVPEKVLPLILAYLDLHELMRLQGVSLHWQNVVNSAPNLLHHLDLSRYNRRVTDDVLINRICPFVGQRPRFIDISNCFHITDEGFAALVNTCAATVQGWRMKSVWDVTAPAILEMATRARGLQEVDLSNCRKVSDTLLARIVGWVVTAHPQAPSNRTKTHAQRPVVNTKLGNNAAQPPPQPAPGTVIGCPDLRSITLSYCKHITDRTMAHIATHAHTRIEAMDLTRCTTITDAGFQFWGNVKFERLKKLCLADCTYLSDQSIVWLVNGAGSGLRQLDLSFCCALSDTATEVLALGCPNLTHLNLSFCGSAVSDPSLRSIGLHLTSLRELAVRGCVRVTGLGVQSVVEGCQKLKLFDVSQCKNLQPWLVSGGIERWRSLGRDVEFVVVSSGSKVVRS
ncbi:cyclic nucleotide-binding domain-containing protein [Cladophialophora carrionii]|uniref:Cyclic nucleotide-binding domain-containing protein n=1 Tax=Cladophialophora carrionii TaxID=86049 RepID=A0A1C1CMX1_9EURO|nr:cyclic nucleotide-binding domain-containing protein [Cladophialophora carrionii]